MAACWLSARTCSLLLSSLPEDRPGGSAQPGDAGGIVISAKTVSGPPAAQVRDGVYNRPMLISLGTGSVEPATGEDFVAESETSGFDHLSRFRNKSPS